MKVHVLILNYNGAGILKRYLPSFVAAVRRSSYPCRLSVVDNASVDESREVAASFGKDTVGWIAMRENRVLCSYNDVAERLDDDILVFMNNDIEVDEHFIDPLVRPFEQSDDVFFVTMRCLSLTDRRYEGNKTKARVRFGVFWASAIYPGYEKEIASPGLTFAGGFGAFDRKKFLELGGYDDLYLPGRLEDADICFHAYKKGWRCLYEPSSIAYHEGGVSFKKYFGNSGTLVINRRNTFLFMWKNLDGWTNFVRLPLWLPLRFLYALCRGRLEEPAGFFKALPLFKKAREKRKAGREGRSAPRLSDAQIFRFSSATAPETGK